MSIWERIRAKWEKWQRSDLTFLFLMALNTKAQKIASDLDRKGLSYRQKMAISVGIDILDGIIGLGGDVAGIPVISLPDTLFDIFTVPIGLALWKEAGLVTLVEPFMPTDVGNTVDAFIPSMTIAGVLYKQQHPEEVM